MNHLIKRSFSAPLWLVICAIVGCADAPVSDWYTYVPTWGPLQEKNTSGIKTPAERIDELEVLAARVSDMSPAEQERTTAELATEIRAELDPMVRAQIVRTLAEMPTQSAAVLIQAGLQDTDRDVRVECCHALGRRRGPEVIALLAGVITGEEDNEVRLAAVRALGQVDDQAAIGALRPALEDADPAMQYLAVQSMRNLSDRDFGNDVNAWSQFATGVEPQVENQGIASSLLSWWVE